MNWKVNMPLAGSLTVSWMGTVANWAAEAKSIFGALAALASLVASCYAVALARKKLSGFKRKGASRTGSKGRKGAEKKGKGSELLLFLLLGGAVFVSSGCTHVAAKTERAKVEFHRHEEVMREESRALTTGVVDALEQAPRGAEVNLARRLAAADQEVEGLPLRRLPVGQALAGNTNSAVAIEDRIQALEGLRVENARLAETVREKESRLVDLGMKYEEERNRRIRWWWKWSSSAFVVMGGLIVLCVFFPVALPIVGRLLGWVVGRIPALAGAMGVVGKDAFDAVVRGVGNARAAMKEEEKQTLDTNLRVETDRAHKELIEQRRSVLGV